MKVIHLHEREAKRVLEACESAQRMLAAAEELAGRDALDQNGFKLRDGIAILRAELGLADGPRSTQFVEPLARREIDESVYGLQPAHGQESSGL